jgi:hypothetical protein
MNEAPGQFCDLCIQYLQDAGAAIRRHLRAVASMESAVRENETGRLAELAEAVGEASMARENAVARYMGHVDSHTKKSICASAQP